MLRTRQLQDDKIVVVSAPARLHLGILDPFGVAGGRKYMCLGLAVREPRTIVKAGRAICSEVPQEVEKEITDVLNRLASAYDINVHDINLQVKSFAPRHVGLGSTTQLKLAAATAVLRLAGLSVDIVDLAKLLGRGEVSGVGTYVFSQGGLVLDSGKRASTDFPKLLLRLRFPEKWNIVIVIPPGRGPGEVEEHRLFSYSSARPDLVHYAHYVVLNRLIPAVQDENFEEFTSALEDLQVTVGKMFSLAQGGIFSLTSQVYIEKLKALGARGVGQSSWGPTVYGFTESRKEAEKICLEIEKEHTARCIVTKADNEGAKVYYITTS